MAPAGRAVRSQRSALRPRRTTGMRYPRQPSLRHDRARLDGRLPRPRRRPRARGKSISATPTRYAVRSRARTATGRSRRVAGDDDRRWPPGSATTAARTPRTRQDTDAPGHARRHRTRPHPVHHRDPRRHRQDARRTHRGARGDRGIAPPRPRAGSDRASLPPETRHDDAQEPPCPPTIPLVDHGRPSTCCPTTSTCRSPPNLSDDLAPLLAGHRRSVVSRRHDRPRRSRTTWPALDRLPRATKATGKVLAALAICPEFVRIPSWLEPPRCNTGTRRFQQRGTRRDCASSPGRDDLTPTLLDARRLLQVRPRAVSCRREVLQGVVPEKKVGGRRDRRPPGAPRSQSAAVAEVADPPAT